MTYFSFFAGKKAKPLVPVVLAIVFSIMLTILSFLADYHYSFDYDYYFFVERFCVFVSVSISLTQLYLHYKNKTQENTPDSSSTSDRPPVLSSLPNSNPHLNDREKVREEIRNVLLRVLAEQDGCIGRAVKKLEIMILDENEVYQARAQEKTEENGKKEEIEIGEKQEGVKASNVE